MSAPEAPPERSALETSESYWLDEEHFLEPLDASMTEDSDPVVIDAAGRMWRLRERSAWGRTALVGGTLLLGLLVVAALLALGL